MTAFYDDAPGHIQYVRTGMTFREYAAIAAMQGLVAETSMAPEAVAQYAVEYADAIIKELQK